jgi:pantetheine-phosphate adenylyltransferase
VRIAVFPGSFNPWHDGHEDVLKKALKMFDKVYVARGYNPDKTKTNPPKPEIVWLGNWEFVEFEGLLKDFVTKVGACAVIKGLRNENDFRYELEQQYWNEDIGLQVPTTYVITDRNLVHISSSAIRMLERLKR